MKLQARNGPKKSQPGNNEKSGSNKDAAPAAPAAPAMTPATQADPPVSPASGLTRLAGSPASRARGRGAGRSAGGRGGPAAGAQGGPGAGGQGGLAAGGQDRPAGREREGNKPPDGEGGGFWGTYSPGNGFLVANTRYGTLNVSGYGLWRYLNQMPNSSTFVDHLGQVRPIVNPRNDLQWHRALVHFRGWLLDPRFVYQSSVWGLQLTDMAMVGYVGWRFERLAEPVRRHQLPSGQRHPPQQPSLLAGNRPRDGQRVLPAGFTGRRLGAPPATSPTGLDYTAMVGNTISQWASTEFHLIATCVSADLAWMPTTGEYGPQRGLGDFNEHKKVATRFGIFYTFSREDRFSQPSETPPENARFAFRTASSSSKRARSPRRHGEQGDYNLLAMHAG